MQKYVWACVLSFRYHDKERGSSSHVFESRFRKDPASDYETTSPRIYVNRRTPSWMLLNFPDSDSQDRSATLQFPRNRLSRCATAQQNHGAKVVIFCHIVTRSAKILHFFHKNTSIPLTMKMQHSRHCRIWLLSSSLNFRVPL